MSGGQTGDQPEQGRFRRGISGLAGRRMKRGITGNENDVTMSLPDHPWQSRSRAISRSLVVHRENIIPLIFLHPHQRNIARDSRVTNQQVNWPCGEIVSDRIGVGHIQFAVTRYLDIPIGIGKCRCNRLSQTTASSCDQQIFHVPGYCAGSTDSGKRGYFQEPGKSLGITSERVGETIFDFKKQGIMPMSCSFVPNLFSPWNPHG